MVLDSRPEKKKASTAIYFAKEERKPKLHQEAGVKKKVKLLTTQQKILGSSLFLSEEASKKAKMCNKLEG